LDHELKPKPGMRKMEIILQKPYEEASMIFVEPILVRI